jgi:hypothetical protein
VQAAPDDRTDVIFSYAPFGEPLRWRDAPFFQARRKFGLQKMPTVWTLLHARPAKWQALLARLERSLAKAPPDHADFAFPGMAPTAHITLLEQGGRGGPLLAAERVLQAQALCLRLLLLIGEDEIEYAHHFDLVGSVARTEGADPTFYDDVVLRVATAASAEAVGKSIVVSPPLSATAWAQSPLPPAMRTASIELGQRNFFTEMVRIADLVTVPALQDAIASQYSEGCFASWEPDWGAMVATITGSARPVDKGNVTDDDLAVISGVNADGQGVLVRQVAGLRNDPPSSEGFEMWDMDTLLPRVTLPGGQQAPVARSKLHGHRGVLAFDPRIVEYVPMPSSYFYYPVTCGTQAQAHGIKAAFARSEALQNPADPRQIIFTILPTHGIFVIEKWVADKAPFQIIWEAMDAGQLQIDRLIPQGPDIFEPQRIVTAQGSARK